MPSPGQLLLTGTSGFVGSHLLDVVLKEGRSVRVASRGHGPGRAGVGEVLIGDLETSPDWRPAVTGVDVVVHCAARAHVLRDATADPLAVFRRVNRDATLTLASAAAAAGVRRFVFLSSIGVLGDRTRPGMPFTSASPPAPEAPYSVSKLEAEEGLLEIGARTGLEVVIVRPPLVHGPGAPGNFGRLLGLVAKGWPLPLGGIENHRTFVGRRNLVDLLRLTIDHPRASGLPLLVGDTRSLSTSELLTLLAEGMGRRSRLVKFPGLRLFASLPGIGSAVRKLTDDLEVDISDTTDRLGWHPPISVEAGLAEMARTWKRTR